MNDQALLIISIMTEQRCRKKILFIFNLTVCLFVCLFFVVVVFVFFFFFFFCCFLHHTYVLEYESTSSFWQNAKLAQIF